MNRFSEIVKRIAKEEYVYDPKNEHPELEGQGYVRTKDGDGAGWVKKDSVQDNVPDISDELSDKVTEKIDPLIQKINENKLYSDREIDPDYKKNYDDLMRLTDSQWGKISDTLNKKGYDIRGGEDAKKIMMKRYYQTAGKNVMNNPGDWHDAYKKLFPKKRVKKERPPKTEHINYGVLRRLGYTNNPDEAGYLTTTGRMIDLSGRKEGALPGHRAYDHRNIGGYVAMQEYMNQGNIRYFPENNGAQLYQKPNAKQQKLLGRLIDMKRDKGFEIDLYDGMGDYQPDDNRYQLSNRYFHQQYPPKTHYSKVLRDINEFYSGKQANCSRYIRIAMNVMSYEEDEEI